MFNRIRNPFLSFSGFPQDIQSNRWSDTEINFFDKPFHQGSDCGDQTVLFRADQKP